MHLPNAAMLTTCRDFLADQSGATDHHWRRCPRCGLPMQLAFSHPRRGKWPELMAFICKSCDVVEIVEAKAEVF
jgi:hypothetical protein